MNCIELLKQLGFKKTEDFFDENKNEHIQDFWNDSNARVVLVKNIDKIRISVYNKGIFHKFIAQTEQEAMGFLKEKFIV